MKNYLTLIRCRHYIKNALVFAALVCSGQLFDLEKFVSCAICFAAFCAVSSVVYIFNDIQDRDRDRLHPKKRTRPIASGAVSAEKAGILALGLLLLALVCNFAVFHPASTALLVLYLVMNLAYSVKLKNIPIVDITILAFGFLIRVLYGAFVTGTTVSNWLYLTVISTAYFFAAGKRRNELRQVSDGETRKVLRYYSFNFLDRIMYMFLGLANAFYSLWSMDEETVSRYQSTHLVFTVPIVFLITMTYCLKIEGDSDGDPVETLFHDKILFALCFLYLLVMFLTLYL